MAKFCTRCGRRLQEGEVCTCNQNPMQQEKSLNYQPDQETENQNYQQNQANEDQYYQQNQAYENQYSQQNQAYENQYNQPNQAYENQYSQQNQTYENSYNQQGQMNEGQYYQQGQMNGSQYYQQNQAYENQYNQQGQPYGNQYNQQGQPYGNQYNQQGQSYGNQYNQQGQPYGNPYNQQGQPYGNPYNQQGMTKEAEWLNQKKDALVAGTKNMFSEIGPILKSPVTRVKQIAESNSPAVGVEFIVTKTIIFLLLLFIVIFKVKSMIGVAGDYVKIPYVKLILLTILFTAGADFLKALLLKGITALFNGATHFNAMLSVMGARALYETLIIIVVGILVLIYPSIGIGFYIFASLIVPYIEYSGYQASVQCDEDKKPYAFFLVEVCMMILMVILGFMMGSDIITSIAGSSLSSFF